MKKMVFVVLHYLTTDDTVECVSSIRRCCADGEYQIIIVDNASPNRRYTFNCIVRCQIV